MGKRKRLAVIATPANEPGRRAAAGALDGDAMRERLPLPDAAFAILDLDPAIDLAEQLDLYFEVEPADRDTEVLFYASCQAAMSADGEFFLCLDPTDTETGDALRDIAGVFRDMAPGPVLFILECRHPTSDDPFRSAAFVQAAKEAVASTESGVELLIAARPASSTDGESVSPFTRVALETLDDADPSGRLDAGELFERMRESDGLLGVVPSFAHTAGEVPFALLVGDARPSDTEAADDGLEADDTRPDDELLPVADTGEDTFVDPTPIDEHPDLPPEVDLADTPVEGAPVQSAEVDEAAVRAVVAAVVSAVSESLAPAAPEPPPVVRSEIPPAPISIIPPNPSSPPEAMTVGDYIESGRGLSGGGDDDRALVQFKKALGLGSALLHERAEIYVLVGQIKERQGKRREAIANLHKGLQLAPDRMDVLELMVELTAAERDWRSLAGLEERVLELALDEQARFDRLIGFGRRWRDEAKDRDRAQVAFERARDLRPDARNVLEALEGIYEESGAIEEQLAVRHRIAELTDTPRDRALKLFALGQTFLADLDREEQAIELFEQALEADPTHLSPLEAIAKLLAERQEWSELEQAYRRMLERAPRIERDDVREEVTWELCRRLGLLFRDHLDDPALALDAFEDALEEKPRDRPSRHIAVELATASGQLERAATHLQVLAAMGPPEPELFHQLFTTFQRTRKPDLAYLAASVSVFLEVADERERIVYDADRPEDVPKLARPARPEALDLLFDEALDRDVQRILAAIAPAAIAARVEMLADEGKLPSLDPKTRQDPETSTVTAVRSLSWGSHFLGIAAPAIYLGDDPQAALLAMPQEEPTTLIGGSALRGRSLADLAFLVGRHLVYHLGENRLLLFYPSLEDLSACFMAAIRFVLPEVPVPPAVFQAVATLRPRFETWMGTEELDQLREAVHRFDEAGTRANLAGWAAAVERSATRAGFVLCGDLGVAAKIMNEDPRGLVPVDDKIADLLGYAISEPHHALRRELGIALEG